MRTVVLSGSLGATTQMWDAQAEALRDFDVVPVEHPGHGGEPMIELDDVRDLARHVLEKVDARRFSFVGLSLGGAVGMRLALDAPERIDRLVLACTSARFGSAVTWDERIALVREKGMEAIADVVLPRWFTPAFDDVQRFRAMFLATAPETYVRYCEILREFDLRGKLDAIAAPTLALAGAEDPTSPPEQVESLAEEIPNASFLVIPRAAHLANVERPAEFNKALLAHLAA
jgi:3-oxoadipate enol-lactonase